MPGAPMPEPTPPTGDASGPPSPDTAAPDGPETATPEAVVRDAAPPPPPPANGVDRTQPLPLSPIAPASDPAVGAPPPAPTRTDADDNRVALLITRITGWLVILAALAVAVALMATIRLGILELRLGFLLWPLALVAFVAACVAVIRARSIAVISATLASLVLVWGIGALATRFDGPTGTRTIVVTDGGDLAPRYHLAAGWLTVDLGSLSIEEPTRVEIENRAGRVDVVVPDDAAVEVDANVWAGRSDVLGSVVEGWRVDDSVREVPRGTTAVLTIDLDVGVGAARLCRASDAGADHRCDR